ncbi:MAG: hypothetical protein IKN55_05425 [Oscillospiraceae bacterium]|nr:hypothetical protein [Oscillospiraceae bacterium]
MNTKTYEPGAGLGKTTQTLRDFGERQNSLNQKLAEQNQALQMRCEVLAEHLGAALERISALEAALAALQKEQELNIRRFHRCAADLDKAEAEIDRLRLTSKLNTNAIERMTRGGEDEA